MGELAVLLEWAGSVLHVMLAHLSLELLLQCVPSALVSVEVVIVGLLCEMSHDLAWRVVEVLLWLSVISKLSSVLAKAWLNSSNDLGLSWAGAGVSHW